MIEQKRRSMLKAISWRFTATTTTIIVSWFVTGTVDMALKIGGVELFAKLFLQYAHERLWTRIRFGLMPVDYQI